MANDLKVLVSGSWTPGLRQLITGLEGGRPLVMGSLTVTAGHDYWVILEYGSSPATPNAGPSPDDAIQLQMPVGIPAGKGHTTPYEIAPRNGSDGGARLRFIDAKGRARRERYVYHPGVRAVLGRGFIRIAVAKIEIGMQRELTALTRAHSWAGRQGAGGFEAKETNRFTRNFLAQIVNAYLQILLENVQKATPIYDGPNHKDQSHLRDAWGIQEAE